MITQFLYLLHLTKILTKVLLEMHKKSLVLPQCNDGQDNFDI